MIPFAGVHIVFGVIFARLINGEKISTPVPAARRRRYPAQPAAGQGTLEPWNPAPLPLPCPEALPPVNGRRDWDDTDLLPHQRDDTRAQETGLTISLVGCVAQTRGCRRQGCIISLVWCVVAQDAIGTSLIFCGVMLVVATANRSTDRLTACNPYGEPLLQL